ncbi:MAG: hypothetical protein HY903_14800 [Deltaproteobacteria bacterium]|nr:hypothetical protein [Deltaproteobacteria bacterium]
MQFASKAVIGVSAVIIIAACGASRKVERDAAPGTGEELSGNWSAVDARETSEALIKDCFSQGWLDGFVKENSRKPQIRVRGIVNKTDEHIDAQVFVKNIEKAMVNSGKVSVLAQEGSELGSVNAEQDYATGGRSEGDNISVGNQKVGDFAVAVRMTSILDQVEGKKKKFYKINFELLNTTTGEKAWIGDPEIQKTVTQKGAKW